MKPIILSETAELCYLSFNWVKRQETENPKRILGKKKILVFSHYSYSEMKNSKDSKTRT